MRIALLSLPKEYKRFEENIQVTSEEFGVHPPLGLAYVASIIREKGHEVIIIDACNSKISMEEAVRRLKSFNPSIIGIEVHSIYYVHFYIKWIRYLKQSINVPVMVGGAGFSLYPKEIMSLGYIDYGFVGPASDSLPEFLDLIEKNGEESKYLKVKGLLFKHNGKIVQNKYPRIRENLDLLPFPARDLLDNRIYHQFISKRKNFTILLTSTGCGLGCIFCDAKNTPFKARKIENVMKEIKECYYKHQIREIDFFDRTFTLDRGRVVKLCNEMIKSKLDIRWSCRTRLDLVDKELLRLMKRAGCFAIFYGVESADKGILNNIKKGLEPRRAREAIRETSNVGISSLGFFMFGNPGDTEEKIEKTIKFALSLNLTYATFTKVTPKPETYFDLMNRKNGKGLLEGLYSWLFC